MGFILTVITILLALDVMWLWQSDRLLRGVRGARRWRLANAAFVIGQVLVLLWIFLGRLLDFDPSRSAPQPFVAAVLIWHLLVAPVAVVMVTVSSIPIASVRAVRSARSRREDATRLNSSKSSDVPTAAADSELLAVSQSEPVTRRSFLRTAAAMAPPLVTGIATTVSMPQLSHFRVRRLVVPLAALPPALDGLTIAHVSDTHVGRFTRGPVLDAIVRATNDLGADLVLLTGDLINDDLGYLDEALDLVKRIDPRQGLAMCEGNHDLIESREEFERRTRASGVPLLINESMDLRVRGERIQLLGLRWGRATPGGTRRENHGDDAISSSLDRVLAQLRSDAFPILLAHHPHAFDPAAAAGIPLILAGHTHGGQLMLSDSIGFGPRMYRYWSGLYAKPSGSLVVSNGVGNWFPLRINAPAEIVHLTLRRV